MQSGDIQTVKRKYNDAEFLFVNAWNEWGEGAYLEPDQNDEYAFLEVLKNDFSD